MRRAIAAVAIAGLVVACGQDEGPRARLTDRCLADTGHAATCGSIVDYVLRAGDSKGCHGPEELEAVDRLAQPFVYGRQSAAEFETAFATCDHPSAPLPPGWPFQPSAPAPGAPAPSS